jgi:hypothetical protein
MGIGIVTMMRRAAQMIGKLGEHYFGTNILDKIAKEAHP